MLVVVNLGLFYPKIPSVRDHRALEAGSSKSTGIKVLKKLELEIQLRLAIRELPE